jgi:hypothetical protein
MMNFTPSALHRFKPGRVILVLYSLVLFILFSFPALSQGTVNGRNVTVVKYPNGSFAQLNPGHWRESNNDGVHDFAETNRDEWSVYMLDQSRDLTIQLDLFKKAIILNWDRPGGFKIYDIFSSEAPAAGGPAGYNRCAGEGEAYNFSSPVDVAYGANGTFVYKTGVVGTITFDNNTFGDPIPGVWKSGYFQPSSVPAPNPNVVVPGVLTNDEAFLTGNDEKLVLKWIMDEVTDAHVEYCWKRSHPRFTEGLTKCPPGKILENLLCYDPCPPDHLAVGPVCWHNCPQGYTNMGPTCLQNAESYSAPSQLANCPPGYTNMGLTCYAGPDTYSAPSIVASCPSGFTNMGASCYRTPDFSHPLGQSLSMNAMVCPGGYFKSGGRCYQNCRDGYTNNGEFCGKGASSLAMSSMVCPSGYFQGIDARCHQNCNDGYTNTGELCTKGANVITNSATDRGVGTPMVCRDGLIHNGAGLCFEPCHPGYEASSNADPVCWQPCPDNQSIACGAGCANATGACIQETWEMVEAVGEMALNVVSLGETSAFTAAKGAVKTAVRAGDRVAAKLAARQAAKELAKSFEQMTSRKVMSKLKENFKDQAVDWIAEEYATLLLKTAKNDEFSTEDLWDLAALDPTGIAEVVHAFYKPVCAKNSPFPAVNLIR